MYKRVHPSGSIQYTWDGPLYILRGHRLLWLVALRPSQQLLCHVGVVSSPNHTFFLGKLDQFPNKIVFLSLKIGFVIVNSEDPDEMLHYVAFHLDLYCL